MHTTQFHRAAILTLLLALLVIIVAINPVLTAGAEGIDKPNASKVMQSVPPGCPAAVSSTFPSTTPVAIPTGPAVVSSTIIVSGANPYLWDVNLNTFITHTFAADLDITLESPAGTIVTLTTDNGSGNDNVFNGTLWDDDGNDPVTDHAYSNLTLASPLSPEEPLAAFIGEDPNGTWTLTISDDLAGDGGSLDSWSLDVTTAPVLPTSSTSSFPSTTPVAIPTGPAVVSSTIIISGANPYLWDVNLNTSITHTFAADLDITLESPAGTIVTLTTDNGSGNDNVFNGTLWDDDGNDPVTDHAYSNLTLASPLSPEEPLAAFIGEDPNGTWTLTISDDLGGDGGSLDGWSLDLETSSGCGPALTVSSTNPSANATLSSLASMNVSFNEDVVNDGSAKAANNIANYLLVERGPNAMFDTVSCTAGVVSDDVKQTIASTSYNSSSKTATVNLASPLANGNYRLFICGTTSIWSTAGRELNDGLSDSTVNFTIATSSSSVAASLPNTGFAPGRVTALPAQPAEKAYTQSDLWLEIPRLGIKMDIVNVPQVNGEWDVTWLGEQAGWLEGSAFPTWSGNSVLTGHVWDANNQPGPFAELKTLKYGDRIIVYGFGQTYTYEVRESDTVSPGKISKVFKHEKNPWITLVTCEAYQENSQEYLYRRVVRAVLISVE